jgi:hypothetical protein
LQQFVVKAAATASGGGVTLTISPPIITSGAYQTVSAIAASGSMPSSTSARLPPPTGRILVFHKNAFGLAVVPMIKPEGAVDVQRVSHNGLSMRMIPVYTGSSDTSAIRLDVLLGTKTIYADWLPA